MSLGYLTAYFSKLIPTEYRADKAFLLTVAQWTFIGLLLRLIIMPFTMHTMDIFFINYFPYQLVTKGVWDVYSFIGEHFPQSPVTYYPPLTYYLIAGFLFFSKPFLPDLPQAFETFVEWNFFRGGETVHYATMLADYQLFRTLFLLKAPYLLFDLAIGFMLLRLAANRKGALFTYKLWMLNPLALHSVYAIGQFELIPTFFVVVALYLVAFNRSGWAVLLLSLGGAVKVYPLFFIPLVVLTVRGTFQRRLKLAALSVIPLALLFIPLSVSSDGLVFRSVFIPALENVTGNTLRKALFVLGYSYLLVDAYQKRTGPDPASRLGTYILLVFLFYSLVGLIKFRYLVWLSPFLALAMAEDRRVRIMALIMVLALGGIHLAGNQVQWGLFAPLHPTFFSSLPILESVLQALSLPVRLIHQGLYLLFLVTTSLLMYRLWQPLRVAEA